MGATVALSTKYCTTAAGLGRGGVKEGPEGNSLPRDNFSQPLFLPGLC